MPHSAPPQPPGVPVNEDSQTFQLQRQVRNFTQRAQAAAAQRTLVADYRRSLEVAAERLNQERGRLGGRDAVVSRTKAKARAAERLERRLLKSQEDLMAARQSNDALKAEVDDARRVKISQRAIASAFHQEGEDLSQKNKAIERAIQALVNERKELEARLDGMVQETQFEARSLEREFVSLGDLDDRMDTNFTALSGMVQNKPNIKASLQTRQALQTLRKAQAEVHGGQPSARSDSRASMRGNAATQASVVDALAVTALTGVAHGQGADYSAGDRAKAMTRDPLEHLAKRASHTGSPTPTSPDGPSRATQLALMANTRVRTAVWLHLAAHLQDTLAAACKQLQVPNLQALEEAFEAANQTNFQTFRRVDALGREVEELRKSVRDAQRDAATTGQLGKHAGATGTAHVISSNTTAALQRSVTNTRAATKRATAEVQRLREVQGALAAGLAELSDMLNVSMITGSSTSAAANRSDSEARPGRGRGGAAGPAGKPASRCSTATSTAADDRPLVDTPGHAHGAALHALYRTFELRCKQLRALHAISSTAMPSGQGTGKLEVSIAEPTSSATSPSGSRSRRRSSVVERAVESAGQARAGLESAQAGWPGTDAQNPLLAALSPAAGLAGASPHPHATPTMDRLAGLAAGSPAMRSSSMSGMSPSGTAPIRVDKSGRVKLSSTARRQSVDVSVLDIRRGMLAAAADAYAAEDDMMMASTHSPTNALATPSLRQSMRLPSLPAMQEEQSSLASGRSRHS